MSPSFERATPADANALLSAEIAAFHHDSVMYPHIPLGGPPGYDDINTVLRKMAEEDYTKIVYEGQIVGGMVVYDYGEGHFHLDLIFIHPDYHSLGIGTRALQFMEAAYPARKWTLNTPTYALRNQHFYEKFGYVKMGEEDETDDITLIIYEKQMGKEL